MSSEEQVTFINKRLGTRVGEITEWIFAVTIQLKCRSKERKFCKIVNRLFVRNSSFVIKAFVIGAFVKYRVSQKKAT